MLKITLKSARVNAGYTLIQASKLLGISKNTLLNWENKPWLINPVNQKKIEEVYNISVDNINFFPKELENNSSML